jgi:RNA polymerase sigma factor (sigma-70 family)
MHVVIEPHAAVGRSDRSAERDLFAAFYRRLYPSVARLAFMLTGDASTAEDIAQEAFTQVHTRFESLSEPRAYLRKTVVNLCRRRHRSTEREAARVRLVQPRETVAALGAEEIIDVLQRLPMDQRTLIVLRFWADWSEAEIAAALSCRRGTVKSRSARALTQLRIELERPERDRMETGR